MRAQAPLPCVSGLNEQTTGSIHPNIRMQTLCHSLAFFSALRFSMWSLLVYQAGGRMGQLQPRLEPHPYTWKCDFHLPLKHSLVPTPNLAPATTWQTDWIFTHRDSAVLDIWSVSPPSATSYFSELYILIKTGASQAGSAFGLHRSSTQFGHWVSVDVDGNMANERPWIWCNFSCRMKAQSKMQKVD